MIRAEHIEKATFVGSEEEAFEAGIRPGDEVVVLSAAQYDALMVALAKASPTGHICGHCYRPMRHNVPRLGPAGGWVHADTGRLECMVVTKGEES